MTKEELMIGDLVSLNGKTIKVEELLLDGINGYWDGNELYGVEAKYEELEEISLTKDVLFELGFIDNVYGDLELILHNDYHDNDDTIILVEGTNEIQIDNEDTGLLLSLEITTLNELQHALRLTGHSDFADSIKIGDKKDSNIVDVLIANGFNCEETHEWYTNLCGYVLTYNNKTQHFKIMLDGDIKIDVEVKTIERLKEVLKMFDMNDYADSLVILG